MLTIGVSTTGPGVAALTFSISLANRDGGGTPQSERVKADGGVATFRALDAGSYVVGLALPAQCDAAGGRERQIVVAAGRTTAVRFTVRCR